MVKQTENETRARRVAEILTAFGAPISFVTTGSFGDPRLIEAAAERWGVLCMSTELGGGGTVSPDALAIGEEGIRRVLRYIGALQPEYPITEAPKTRWMEAPGRDCYVYSAAGGLFEPCVELGAVVEKGQFAGAVHFVETPWREAAAVSFGHGGTVICKRLPGRVERGRLRLSRRDGFAGG